MIGYFVEKAFRLANKIRRPHLKPALAQELTLRQLLYTARETAFGKHYNFSSLLTSPDLANAFRREVPIFDYDKIFNEWWHRLLESEGNICWPGRIHYFALSSGTSGAPSKYIPVSKEMQRSMRRTGLKLFMTLPLYNIPPTLFEKQMLMIGGSASLNRIKDYYVGDLSGINGASPPFWIKGYYKPGTEIAKTRDWNKRTSIIVENAPKWDVGYVSGIPSWVQMTIKAIVEKYKLDTIHDLWPNLSVFVSGGISFKPYEKSFKELFRKEMLVLDSYLASEGFIAFQSHPGSESLELQLDNGIFMEFVPFNEQNFDADGDILPHAQALLIDEVEENLDYALLLSTNSGAWRYFIGDLVRFTDIHRKEIIITGRTKHFLSVCGEHLSVDNMNTAILKVQDALKLKIPEFTVSAIESGNSFSHKWYIGLDEPADRHEIINLLDRALCEINDDYATERNAGVLCDLHLEIIPTQWFYDFMAFQGKLTGQTKFPRVMKNHLWHVWETFLSDKRIHSLPTLPK